MLYSCNCKNKVQLNFDIVTDIHDFCLFREWEGNIGEETLQLLMDDGEDRVVNDEWRIGNVYEVVSQPFYSSDFRFYVSI